MSGLSVINRRVWLMVALVALIASASLLAQYGHVRVNGITNLFRVTNLELGLAGVQLSADGDGAITFLGQGDGTDENLTLNLDDVSNTVGFSSTTGVTTWTLTGLTTMNFGAAGVRLTQDEDGALTLLSLGNGFLENLTLNLDDTTNTGVLSSSTGLTTLTLTGIALNPSTSYQLNGVLTLSATAPTISSGFGTTPSVPSANGTAAFTVDVGTGGTASTGVLAMPTATTGWNCNVDDITTPASFVTDQTASTTTTVSVTNYSRTTGLAIAWTASDILRFACAAY